jgi:hypothetical protein
MKRWLLTYSGHSDSVHIRHFLKDGQLAVHGSVKNLTPRPAILQLRDTIGDLGSFEIDQMP